MQTITLNIPGINCGHCLMTVKREAGLVEGAEFVSGDIATKMVTFNIATDSALAALKSTLAEAGYPVQG